MRALRFSGLCSISSGICSFAWLKGNDPLVDSINPPPRVFQLPVISGSIATARAAVPPFSPR